MSASLYDFRDLDLLLKLADEADEEGWVEIGEMADAIGVKDNRSIGSRFAWMKRYGMLDYDEKRKLWKLTPAAERVTQARLKAAAARQLQELPEEQMVDVMASVTTHWSYASPMTAAMLRREFLYGTQPGMRNGRRRR